MSKLKENDSHKCPKGTRWCPIHKKCIPEEEMKGKGQRQGRGGGKGPMGIPKSPGGDMDNVKEAYSLVDIILDGNYSIYLKEQQAIKSIDEIVDKLENELDNVPDQDLPELHQRVTDELSKDSMQKAEPEQEPEHRVEEGRLNEDDYKAYFASMLKKHGGPAVMKDPAKKKAFFNAVKKGWAAQKKGVKESRLLENDYKAYFASMLKQHGGPAVMKDPAKKKSFFNAVKKGWAAQKKSGK